MVGYTTYNNQSAFTPDFLHWAESEGQRAEWGKRRGGDGVFEKISKETFTGGLKNALK